MINHTHAAKLLYGVSQKPTPNAPTSHPSGRAAAGAVLYGSSNSTQVGSLDNAIRSTFDRIEASHRGDAERLRNTQHSAKVVRSLFERAKVAPSDAHAILSVYGECRAHPRSEAALAKNWEGPHGFDRLRREAGSTEAAMAQIARTDAVLKLIKQEDPILAQDLVRTGASQDPRFIQTAAKFVDSLQPAKPIV